MSTVSDAARVVAISSGIGAGLGVVGAAARNDNAFGSAASAGAIGGAGLVTLGGLIWAVFSEKDREEALEASAIGLGACIVAGLLGGR